MINYGVRRFEIAPRIPYFEGWREADPQFPSFAGVV